MTKNLEEFCEVCGRKFKPKFPGARKCVFCWATLNPRNDNEKRTCPGCDQGFTPVLAWYTHCVDCYISMYPEQKDLVLAPLRWKSEHCLE